MTVQIIRRQFTVADYYRMLESGILNEDDRVELIDGEIREMTPINSVHTASVKRLNDLLMSRLQGRFIIGVQDPVWLDELNEPEPDLSVLRWHDDYYEQHHPRPGDILLLIEVANTSLAYDREEKLPRYATAAIPEVWLVNIALRVVEQYTQPFHGKYTLHQVLGRGAMLQAGAIPELAVPVDRIFGL
jgi:Uma2 family endonuclease